MYSDGSNIFFGELNRQTVNFRRVNGNGAVGNERFNACTAGVIHAVATAEVSSVHFNP